MNTIIRRIIDNNRIVEIESGYSSEESVVLRVTSNGRHYVQIEVDAEILGAISFCIKNYFND